MLPRERLSYSSPFTRPPLKLPGKARMIVWSVVNIEEWEITRPMARQLSQPPMGQTPIPDMPNWTWYEYGMRVGFWRLNARAAKRRRHPDHVDQRQGLRDLSGGRRRGARRQLGVHGARFRADADPADRGPTRRHQAIVRRDRKIHRQAADRLARPGPRPDLRHFGLRHRMRPDLVRRLDPRRPAAVGQNQARPDPRRALQRRDQRHHADDLAPPRVRTCC